MLHSYECLWIYNSFICEELNLKKNWSYPYFSLLRNSYYKSLPKPFNLSFTIKTFWFEVWSLEQILNFFMPVYLKMTLVKLKMMATHVIQVITSLHVPSFQPKLCTQEYSHTPKMSFLDFQYEINLTSQKWEKSRYSKENHKTDSDYTYFHSTELLLFAWDNIITVLVTGLVLLFEY